MEVHPCVMPALVALFVLEVLGEGQACGVVVMMVGKVAVHCCCSPSPLPKLLGSGHSSLQHGLVHAAPSFHCLFDAASADPVPDLELAGLYHLFAVHCRCSALYLCSLLL